MTLQWILASLHLLGLGIGLGAVWARGRALGGDLDRGSLRRVFLADSWWGLAAVLWIVTGLIRAFGGVEKGTAYYLHNNVFLVKMALLLVILVLEIRPMLTLIRWRVQVSRGEVPTNLAVARAMARISYLEAGLVVLMVLAATAMARGFGV
jgi:putative membrane protein